MRYTLKDYQADAVADVLRHLHRARDNYQRYEALSQFALAATTGAGKTVMTAAVIEALFFGSDEFDFEPDPGATVLWFSDDPSLNEQSRIRINAASSELGSRLRTVEASFSEESFAPGMVYFLNAQKLREGGRLVRGATAPANSRTPVLAAPDMAQRTLYDVIAATVAREGRTLYFILDEAHRGMKPQRDRQTIVQRLINGTAGAPPMPIVFGISATVERFTQAMAQAQGRDALSPVQVDPVRVQASGLLKDDIVLVIPAEAGVFDTTLLREAVRRTKASTEAWAAYAVEQSKADPVVPLLVVQVADKPSDDHLSQILDVIHDEWPEMRPQDIAHVFGTHADRHLPGQVVNYIAPQRVQDATHIRVLLAMEAISTGWDCPRAEVLMSFRTYQDATYVHQLLGRMMRTPLARRIPGNEVLNSVDCLLPHFDRDTATTIAEKLMRGQSDLDDPTPGPSPDPLRRVLFDPVRLEPNEALSPEVWAAFDALPSVTIPGSRLKPIKRLDRLAARLTLDGVKDDAFEAATERMCAVLDGRAVEFKKAVADSREDVLRMSAEVLRGRAGTDAPVASSSLTLNADARAIEHAYSEASRALSDWLASAYVDHIAPPGDETTTLADAHLVVAALGRTSDVVQAAEDAADALVRQWLDETRVARRGLSDEQQAEYDTIEGASRTPEEITVSRPKVAQADRRWRGADRAEHEFPTRTGHLMSAPDGTVPVDLNDWETRVLDQEAREESFRGWYRNPSRATRESLAVAYRDGTGQWQALRPDFVFFHETAGGQIVADIVDPHGHHLSDALPKLRGLADFAEQHSSGVRRIESIAETDGEFRVLDLTQAHVRAEVRAAQDAKALYRAAPRY